MKDVTADLPDVIRRHLAAHNTPDPHAFVDTFAEDALLNDAHREFLGRTAIAAWADREIFGDNVRVELVRAYEHHGAYVVHARFDGDFDKTNLPDPVILTSYFHLVDDRISQLVILLNRTSWPERAALKA